MAFLCMYAGVYSLLVHMQLQRYDKATVAAGDRAAATEGHGIQGVECFGAGPAVEREGYGAGPAAETPLVSGVTSTSVGATFVGDVTSPAAAISAAPAEGPAALGSQPFSMADEEAEVAGAQKEAPVPVGAGASPPGGVRQQQQGSAPLLIVSTDAHLSSAELARVVEASERVSGFGAGASEGVSGFGADAKRLASMRRKEELKETEEAEVAASDLSFR